MNVTFDNINTADAATMLGVHTTTVSYWCRNGLIRFTDLSDGTNKSRYMFTADELDRVNNLITKYGKKGWTKHSMEGLDDEDVKPVEVEAVKPIITTTDPAEYIPDNTDEIVCDIKKLRALIVQREKLLNEVDSVDEAIRNMREKVIKQIP